MKQPLNYAILLYFTTHTEGDADSVMTELAPEYGSYRMFKRASVIESLMTAKENGILEDVRAELGDRDGDADRLRVCYQLTEYGEDLIKRFL